MLSLKIIAGISLALAIAWLVAKPGYDSGLAAIGAVSALLAAIIGDKRRRGVPSQKQNIANGSVGIQAAGDVSIGSIVADNNVK